MAKRLEKQLEFDFMKDVKVKKRVNPALAQEQGLLYVGIVAAGIVVGGAYLYQNIPQIYRLIKNSIEYLL